MPSPTPSSSSPTNGLKRKASRSPQRSPSKRQHNVDEEEGELHDPDPPDPSTLAAKTSPVNPIKVDTGTIKFPFKKAGGAPKTLAKPGAASSVGASLLNGQGQGSDRPSEDNRRHREGNGRRRGRNGASRQGDFWVPDDSRDRGSHYYPGQSRGDSPPLSPSRRDWHRMPPARSPPRGYDDRGPYRGSDRDDRGWRRDNRHGSSYYPDDRPGDDREWTRRGAPHYTDNYRDPRDRRYEPPSSRVDSYRPVSPGPSRRPTPPPSLPPEVCPVF
jgi:hypothetical protein